MMVENLKETLKWARREGIAVGAFNILNYQTALAVVRAAHGHRLPVILQTSVTTVKKYGVALLGDMLYSLKAQSDYPVILHLDHCRDPELAKACIGHRFDSVMLDASHLPLEENIAVTREIASFAHEAGKQVEGELGVIAGVEEDIQAEVGSLVDLKTSLDYIARTGIDLYAPAIGTAHGEYTGVPKVNCALVAELSAATDCPVVVHGGTGLSQETFHTLIVGGASKINVSTAIKIAYMNAVGEFCSLKNPLEFDEQVGRAVQATVSEHLRIFSQKGTKERAL